MAKDPAMLFYTSDFIVGTMAFSDEQVGKYIRLLCMQHQHGHLTMKEIMSILKVKDMDILSKFKEDERGLFYNERLDIESNKRKKYVKSRQNNLLGHSHMDAHMENENVNEDINTNEDEKKKKHLFSESEFFEFEKFAAEMGLKGWPVDKSTYYHQAMLDWSDGITSAKKNPQKAIDWIRTALAWERRDKQEGKGYYKDKKSEGTGRIAEIL